MRTRYAAPVRRSGRYWKGFVGAEISRQLTWSAERPQLCHYRDRNKVEVDLVMENRRGQVVAIEVKAASTVRAEDFRGLRHLADRLGDDFRLGVVLHTGDTTLPFGPKLRAVPVSALWLLQAGGDAEQRGPAVPRSFASI